MELVVVKECKTYSLEHLIPKINEAIKLIGGWHNFVKKGDIVLLKVNLIGPKSSESAAVTHCEFVRAMVRILKDQGCTVWIGDSAGGAIAGIAPTAQSLQVAGYEMVAREEGAMLKNFDREGVIELIRESKSNEKLYVAKPVFDADVVINLPKLKTHSAGFYTGAVKNVFGCIPGLRKAKYHRDAPNPEDFGEIFVDIHKGARFQLHVMDGILAMQGEGPTAGEVYQANKILVSTDPLALDTVAAKMLNMDIIDIPILSAAIKRKLGESVLSNINLQGDYSSVPRLANYKLPKRFKSTKKRNHKALIRVIDFLKARPAVNLSKCKACNVCVESCPVGAINKNTKQINYDLCIECMCCHELCMHKAVDLRKVNMLARISSVFFKGHK